MYAERVKAQMAGGVVKPFWVSHTAHHAAAARPCNDRDREQKKIKITDSTVITTAAEHIPSPLTHLPASDTPPRLSLPGTTLCIVMRVQVERADAESVKNWDRFYKRNTDRFFKDRHYLAHEFADLTHQLHSLTAAGPSSATATADAAPVHLLEVGCGVGNALFPLRAMFPTLRLHGCDCSKNAIALIRQREEQEDQQADNGGGGGQDRLDVWVQDVVTEPFPARLLGSMHFATLIFVLSALAASQHRAVLTSIHSVLAPGSGVLYLRDYAVYDFSQLRFSSGSVLGERLYVRADGTRSYFFVLSELEALLVECGYEVLSSGVVERQVENRKDKLEMRRRFVQIRAKAMTAAVTRHERCQ